MKFNTYKPVALLLSLTLVGSCGDRTTNSSADHSKPVAENSTYFENPVLGGDYPDPTILRDGTDYYMTHSSFEYYPGLLIWHSEDLLNWKPITHALHTNVGSVYAPELIKHKEKFYIYFPANGTNWVVTATNPKGPWSEPVDLKIGRIDPGHVVDENGERYLHMSGGHFYELSDDGLSIISEDREVYEGWDYPDDWLVECRCQESPKLTLREGYYYLTVAQGGTAGPATSHMVISARSKNPWGPWEHSPHNPIVRTQSANEKWWSTGHASLVDTPEGDWYMFYHGYEKNYLTLGRQTLIEPVVWDRDGWFTTANGSAPADSIRISKVKLNETIDLSDNFENGNLGLQWRLYNDNSFERISIADGTLTMTAEGSSPSDSPPLTVIPYHHRYETQVEINLEEGTKAGLILFYNEKMYAGIEFTPNGFHRVRRGQVVKRTEPYTGKMKVFLKLINNNHQLAPYYSEDGIHWKFLGAAYEVSGYHHNVLYGFTSLRIGIYATGEGEVQFRDFKYSPISD